MTNEVTNEEKLMLLRVQLYAAAQTLKGADLEAFRALIREMAVVLDIRTPDGLYPEGG